ncbi:MAG: hypothetical protein A2583_16650 [Bdellovibrionales bacterium RIFOXYD1_FULL_53_11]|nr:MAG: hypothetical protein A2583_16650 [Bdellovibrionales bacterium RIFOXYD1_FULL_53_11]
MTIKKSKEYLIEQKESRFLEEILGVAMTFGMAIESLREREGISQSGFARRIGVSKQYLCDIEKGRRMVSTEQAARFARAFGHPPSLFVRLAIQDDIRASGLKLKVTIEEEAA